jgi:hypothetical protein
MVDLMYLVDLSVQVFVLAVLFMNRSSGRRRQREHTKARQKYCIGERKEELDESEEV